MGTTTKTIVAVIIGEVETRDGVIAAAASYSRGPEGEWVELDSVLTTKRTRMDARAEACGQVINATRRRFVDRDDTPAFVLLPHRIEDISCCDRMCICDVCQLVETGAAGNDVVTGSPDRTHRKLLRDVLSKAGDEQRRRTSTDNSTAVDLYTDVSVHPRAGYNDACVIACVDSTGHYLVTPVPLRPCRGDANVVLFGELHAILNGIERCGRDADKLNVHTDSLTSVRLITAALDGRPSVPQAAAITQLVEHIVERIRILQAAGRRVTLAHIKGHAGNPGNDTAHALANLVRRARSPRRLHDPNPLTVAVTHDRCNDLVADFAGRAHPLRGTWGKHDARSRTVAA